MRYTMPFRVRYSETDETGHVNLHKLLDYFQDSSIFHSESLGYTVQKELEINRGWFLLAWNLEVNRFPTMGEELKVVTEPYKMRGFYGYRRYILMDQEDHVLASADSLWILMNLSTFTPIRVPQDMTDAYISGVTDDKIRVKRKLDVTGEWVKRDEILIDHHYVDSNSHVNNAYYAMWAEDMLPDGFHIKKVMIDYRQSAFEKDTIIIETIEEKGKIRCRFTKENDMLLALVELYSEDFEE
ncbi:MAG: thioesterase [Eubacteriales bacterium]|nr:thioesterase [Eubacteriales bacterium]